MSELVYLLNRELVNFIVNVQTLDVLAIAFDCVNQVIHVVVASEHHLRVVDFVLVHYIFDHFLVYFSQLDCCIEDHTPCLLRTDLYVGLFLVQLNPHCLQFPR